MTNTLTAKQIAQGWIAYAGNGEPPFKKEVNGPPFQLGRMHDGELCTTAVITESLPDEIDWSNVAAYRVWVPSPPYPPVSGEAWTDEQISKLGPWQRIMDKGGLDWCRDYSKEGDGHDMAAINKNSLFRLVGLIDALMAISPLTNEPVVSFASYMQAPMEPSPIKSPHSAGVFPKDHIPDAGKMIEPVEVMLNYKDACTIAVWLGVQIPERGEFRDVYARLSAAIGEPPRSALEGET